MVADERKRTGLGAASSTVDIVGKALWVTFAIVILSGIGLAAGYKPTVAGAFQSVEHIQTSFPFGWWLRGIHKYGCDLLIILAGIRVIRLMYRRAYRPPGHFTWLMAISILVIAIVSGITGYLLVWNQRAFWEGRLLGGNPILHPLGGLGLPSNLAGAFFGGSEVSQVGLTVLYAMHVGLSVIVLLVVLRWRTMPWRQSPKHLAFNPAIPSKFAWTILGALTLLALLVPPPLGSPIDRVLAPHPVLSDWFMLSVYQVMDVLSPGVGIFMVIVAFAAMVFLPWLDRSMVRGPHPVITSIIVAGILCTLFTTAGFIAGWVSPLLLILGIVLIWGLALGQGINLTLGKEKLKAKRVEEEVSGE
jgi:quinol-cytochrome oxidoreductase complex cytochrome b subunit